ncbi:MAG: GWxTD domain-containing protein [Gemmatimonadota bacterium]
MPDALEGAFGQSVEAYRDLGFIAGPGYFPAVADFSTLAGPADSTFVLFGLSLPNSALRFQRDAAGFSAEYLVNLTFSQDSVEVKRETRRERVRVGSFAETGRTEETIVFQHLVALAPGSYVVAMQAADANSSRGFRTVDTLEIPDYGRRNRRLSSPVLIYRGDGRTERDVAPQLILSPRHTVAYGGDPARIYIETYGSDVPTPVDVAVTDELENPIWSVHAEIASGDSSMRHATLQLPSATLPLGKLLVKITMTDTGENVRTPLLIALSDQWIVTDFEEVLRILEYIGTRAEIDSLRNGTPTERRRLWNDFWARRDPLPSTPPNEYRDEFFDRVRSTEQFSEVGGLPGWRTDRGEVYIVLGPPSFSQERYLDQDRMVGRPNAIEWVYQNAPGGRLDLLFIDRSNFGRYDLTPSSTSAFRGIAERLKRQWEERGDSAGAPGTLPRTRPHR